MTATHEATFTRYSRGKQRWSNFNLYGWTIRCSCGWVQRYNGPKKEAVQLHRDHARA